MKELATALAKAQSEFTTVPQSGFNPHFKNKFSTLEDCINMTRPILARHGLAISQMPNTLDGQYVLTTILMHESGESIVSNQPVVSMKNDPQSLGSALSYCRRYSLTGVLSLASGDFEDDGNAATAPAKPTPAKAKATKNQSIAERVNAAQHVGELMSLFEEVKGQINEDDKALFSQRKAQLTKG
tara:strand:+ start:839 stop:1393 length:555 start_codon:yes stop_codon:yes gene_type:complete